MAWPVSVPALARPPALAAVLEASETTEAPDAALGGARGGLWLWPFALGPESALLMVAAVWLEYPESLWRSLWPPLATDAEDLSLTSGFERLAATLAFSLPTGDRRKVTSSQSLFSDKGQSSTVAWSGLRASAMAATRAEQSGGGREQGLG